MRLVRDGEGTSYVVLEESSDAALVRNPATGTEQYLPTSDLVVLDDESPLLTAADALPTPTKPPLDTIADRRALGLLVHLDANGPQPVTALLDLDTLCESDLHGATGELRAAGLIEETRPDGLRGYRVTDLAREQLERLRD